MRNLTIKRAKRFVGCLGTMKVYIEDPQANDMTINGVTCRMLGTLKNGETKTFSVSEAAAKVFVIAGKLSKGFCNEYYPLPESTEDILLTGKNCFNPAAGNAFRFDGVVDPAVLANRKKTTRKGMIVLIAAAIVGAVVGFVIGGQMVKNMLSAKQEPKEYQVADLRITLTEQFKDFSVEGYTGGFQTRDVAILILQENRNMLEAGGVNSLTQYAKLVQQVNKHNAPIQEEEHFLYYEYDFHNSTTNEDFHYFVMMYKNPVDFYIVQFAVRQAETENYREQVMEWAKSVNVN